MKIETDKRPASFALASFHHAISEGDLRKVKDYVQGISSIPGTSGIRISCNQQDEVLHRVSKHEYWHTDVTDLASLRQLLSNGISDQDGFAAVHWAAIKGRLEILRYLVAEAPENNRADPTMADRDGWTALTWAIFSAESAGKGAILSHAPPRRDITIRPSPLPSSPPPPQISASAGPRAR
jgi:ankyrin repeat protein